MILVNGIEADSLSTSDRGLQYGDGLFETLAVQDGIPLCWERHIQRLRTGCERLRLSCPDGKLLSREAARVSRGLSLGVLKMVITRGPDGRGYKIPAVARPTRILSSLSWPEFSPAWSEQGVVATVCKTRLSPNPCLAGIKHLNRLEQVLARSEWDDPQIAEGLMLDAANRVVEGTMSNVFMVKQGRLLTPDLADAGVEGIMRGLVLELARAFDVTVKVQSVNLADLENAEELFLSNSLFGIWPIRKLGDTAYRVGPLSLRLRDMLIADGYIAGQSQ